MSKHTTTSEEVTTIEHQAPQQVVTKTVTQAEPHVKEEHPQSVYEKKKTILRSHQVIWYVLGVIEALLMFRLILKMLGANTMTGFTNLIYTITTPIAGPFVGVVPPTVSGNSMIEWSTIIAAIVYICVAWGVVYFLELIYPISKKDVETQ